MYPGIHYEAKNNVNSVFLRLTMKCGSFGAKLNRGRCGLPEQKHGKPCAPKTKQQQKRWWAIAASGCQTTSCTTVLPACLARHFWGCTQIALKRKCSLVKNVLFFKRKIRLHIQPPCWGRAANLSHAKLSLCSSKTKTYSKHRFKLQINQQACHSGTWNFGTSCIAHVMCYTRTHTGKTVS